MQATCRQTASGVERFWQRRAAGEHQRRSCTATPDLTLSRTLTTAIRMRGANLAEEVCTRPTSESACVFFSHNRALLLWKKYFLCVLLCAAPLTSNNGTVVGSTRPSTHARVSRRPRNGTVASSKKGHDNALFCGSQVALVKDTRGVYHVVRNVEMPKASSARAAAPPPALESPRASRNRSNAAEDDVIASFSKRFKWVQTRNGKSGTLRSQQNWSQTNVRCVCVYV